MNLKKKKVKKPVAEMKFNPRVNGRWLLLGVFFRMPCKNLHVLVIIAVVEVGQTLISYVVTKGYFICANYTKFVRMYLI